MFSHLHTHSHFSLLSGIPSPAQLVQRAAQLGMPALALTDHDRLTGAIEFYDACREAGIQPLIGLELRVAIFEKDSPPLIFLAMDLRGWTSLCCLSSLLLDSPAGPRASLALDDVHQNSAGLLCLAGAGGWLANGSTAAPVDGASAEHSLGLLQDIFPGRLYLEMQATRPDGAGLAGLARLSQRLRIPAVGTGSVYYLQPEQQHLQELLSAIRLNT
ncbi:MAG: PHP domain-containing protein, partial [Anaerolineaceae bacterium]